jgi:hypothetical protein
LLSQSFIAVVIGTLAGLGFDRADSQA